MHIVGAILILIGLVSLLDNFGFLPVSFWQFFWPALLIVIGLSFLYRSKCKECGGRMWCSPREKENSSK